MAFLQNNFRVRLCWKPQGPKGITCLSQYHSFVVQRTFSLGLMAAPGTDTILGRLGGDGADQVLSRTPQGYIAHKKTPTPLGPP